MRLFIIVVLAAMNLPAAEPVLRQTFAKDTEGWVTMGGPSGRLEAKDGQLSFTYTAAAQGMSVAVLPTAAISLQEMKSLRFQVRTDSPFAIGIVLSEKKPGGGNYSAAFWSNGEEWQTVTLKLADFSEGEGPNEPSDSNSKLDLDQVEGIGVIDVSQIFSRLSHADSPVFAKAHQGEHTIGIRNFEISREAVAADAFPAGWFGLADCRMTQVSGGLKIEYEQQPEQAVAFLHTFPPASDFRGSTHIAFDITSLRPSQMVLSLQEARHHTAAEAPRYNLDFFVPASEKPQHREILLSAFVLDENGTPDKDGKLDLDDLRSLSFLDMSRETGANVLTISNLKFVRR